jgi:thioredoxin reductase (NADPH)
VAVQPEHSRAIVPILGGGPAGISCALWLSNYGLRPLIVEAQAALGGMARRDPYPNPWLLGRPGMLGRENAAEFARHIEAINVECWFGARPQRVRRLPDGQFELNIGFSDRRPPRRFTCAAIVIATGTEFRGAEWLDAVENAHQLAQRGRVHLGPAWSGEPGVDLGSRIAVIGGGDNAFDVGRILIERGVTTSIIVRAKSSRAQRSLVERVRAYEPSGRAEVLTERTVRALEEVGAKVRLHLSDGSTREVDHVILLLGYRPNTHEPGLAELRLKQDSGGYLIVDGNMETSCRGVFAAGDVANPVHPCIATAIATGTMAAREIQKRFGRGA